MSQDVIHSETSKLESTLTSLLSDYRDLQPPRPTILDNPPTSIEALRMIHAAHPTIIHGCSPLTSSGGELDWDTVDTYKRILGDGDVTIAITDDGYADSVRQLTDGTMAFVKPLEEKMGISQFLDKLRNAEEADIMYLQSQDGNVYRSEDRIGGDELKGMRSHLERDVSWMKDAVGESAEAVNLWIGSSRSVTSLHHDPYDNIYHVLSGTKTFTLISPIEGLWLSQNFYPPATLERVNPEPDLKVTLDDPTTPHVPWVASDIFPPPIQPIRITLHQGQTLFLPSGWWHRVEQSEGSGGIAVAVNYWYNSTIHPSNDALFKLAQRVAGLSGRTGVLPVDLERDSGSESGSGKGIEDGFLGEDGESESGEEWEPSEWGR